MEQASNVNRTYFYNKSIRQRALTVVNVLPRWGNCWKRKDIDSTSWLTCSTGVLIARVNVTSAQSFTRPTMFDEKLEWTVGEEALPSPSFRPSLPHPPPPLSTNLYLFLSPTFRCCRDQLWQLQFSAHGSMSVSKQLHTYPSLTQQSTENKFGLMLG